MHAADSKLVPTPDRICRSSRPIPALAGIGLRPAHVTEVLRERPSVPWFEVHPENFMTSGALRRDLFEVAEHYALSLHSVGLSLGSTDAPERSHLERLRALADWTQPDLISDHLSWSAVDGVHLPDLLTLPYHQEALQAVVRNIHIVQDTLKRRLHVENPSRYAKSHHSALTENEFLAEVVLRTGCGVVLDVNNLYVSSVNLGEDPAWVLEEFLALIEPEDIGEIHLAGHSREIDERGEALLIDTHGSKVAEPVWSLFETAIIALGPRPVLIEWDTDLPAFATLVTESARAGEILKNWRFEAQCA